MPGFGAVIEQFGKSVGTALAKPAIPEIAERSSAAMIEAGRALPSTIGERHAGVAYHGDPQLRLATRATEMKPETVQDWVREKKRAVLSFIQPDPDMPQDIAKRLVNHRHAEEQSNYLAAKALQPVYGGLKRAPVEQAAAMWDYAVVADDYAQALRDGYDTILKVGQNGESVRVPVQQWAEHLERLKTHAMGDPEIVQALDQRTKMWHGVFQDMVNEGAIVPERELSDYTPMRHLTSIARGLAVATGDESLVRKLATVQKRNTAGGVRETNLASLEYDVIRRFLRWKAQRNLFNDLMSDASLNLTDKFEYGEPLPSNLTRYDPRPGQIGYMPRPAETEMLAGASDALRQDRYANGGFVIPKALKRAFEEMQPHDSAAEDVWRKAGRRVARWLTVYNPKNLALNVGSDLVTALVGLPGEPASPLGVLRWYGKTATSVIGHELGGAPVEVVINGQRINVSDLARSEGLGGSTFMHQVAGTEQSIPRELEQLMPPGTIAHPNPAARFAQELRQGAELAPRIAAGLDALERTGDISQFGRVGRQITLEYGAGGPLAARLPVWRMLAPFIQYTGLATRRVFELATTKGSRGRTWASIVAVPIAAMMWNTRNDEFRQIEDALPEYERGQMHVIVPDPSDPEKVKRDVQGKPVVLRFRYMITEEVMKNAGLGNLATRLARVLDERDTPMQFAKQSMKSAAGNMGSLLTMPGLALDALSDTDRYGKQRDIGEKVMRTIPLAKIINEGWTSTRDYGAAAGAQRTVEELAGASFATPVRKGKKTLDATLMEHIYKLRDAKAAYKNAKVQNKSTIEVAERKKKLFAARDELQRYVRATKKARNLSTEEVTATKDAYAEGATDE